MKYILIFLTIPMFALGDCGNKKKKEVVELQEAKEEKVVATDSLVPCVRKLIDSVSKKLPEETPSRIDEYLYNGQQVFLLMAPCCDNYDILFDKNCNQVCAPTGGFSGRGDGKCLDFIKEAKLIKTIWKNE